MPVQKKVTVYPGDNALAVYQATNKTEKPVIGVATYNVTPAAVAPYFVKVQCFCFEHQRLGPHETVDMPVLFYLDPEVVDDPVLHDLSTITLSYTFFRAEEGDERTDRARSRGAVMRLWCALCSWQENDPPL